MKKFFLLLLITGMSGFAGRRESIPLDFDVGYPAQQKFARFMFYLDIKSRYQTCKKFHNVLIGLNEITDTDKRRESQNAIEEARIHYGLAPFIRIENTEDTFHHQVHTHDVPYWNILRKCREVISGKLYIHPQQNKLPDKGMSGHQLLPILPERTAP